MALVLVILLVGIILLAWLNFRSKLKLVEEKIKGFEGTNQTWPLIGDVHMIFGQSINGIVDTLVDGLTKRSNTGKIWVGPKLVICPNTPEDIKTVLTSPHCYDKAGTYKVGIGGSGILVADTIRWKMHRRLLNSTFALPILENFLTDFNRFGENLNKKFEKHAGIKKPVDIRHTIGVYVTDLTLRTIFGSRDHVIDLPENCYTLVEQILYIVGQKVIKFYSHFVLILIKVILKIKPDEVLLVSRLKYSVKSIVTNTTKKYVDENGDRMESEEEIKRNMNDNYLERLVRLISQGHMTRNELRDNIITIFIAGSDTTTTAISNILVILAIFKDVQEKVYDEICTVIGKDFDGVIDTAIISKMTYLDCVVKEAMRVIPVITIIARRANKDIQLEKGIIPAGTDIIVSLASLHKNKNVWGENADKFYPEHFLPENVEKRHRNSYIPFSYGQRNCIGYRYASLLIRIALIRIVRSYKFSTDLKFEDLRFGFGVTTILLNGHDVTIEKRN